MGRLPRYLIPVIALLMGALQVSGQGKTNKRYADYIERYAPMAVEQMQAHGIPASITLAQGLLESAAGNSRLAREGNNHFGIKCGGVWTGDTMLRDDDMPDECFRVYASARESFNDHSKFLKGKRYRPLFELDRGDYAGWARGLSACGYATDPNYADRLITIIELYALYNYDGSGSVADDADFIVGMLRSKHPVRRFRGLHYVIAAPGDCYATIAKEFGIPTADLLRYNDVGADREIKPWQEVYLQEKHDTAPDGLKKATIGEGESMHSVSQRFGIKLAVIKKLNANKLDAEGVVLRMR